ncbi:adenosine deaminase [Vibrio sp. AK197]|uniref:Adenosine deaminase n=1 Tax=Vibrio olivae TaxID=1243002 RepID=A0ABV5HN32_9VIBR
MSNKTTKKTKKSSEKETAANKTHQTRKRIEDILAEREFNKQFEL